MIEADQATEPSPSANEKEGAAPLVAANPAGTVPLAGQYWAHASGMAVSMAQRMWVPPWSWRSWIKVKCLDNY